MSHRRVTWLSAEVIGDLVAELGPVWQARQEARLTARCRQRAMGAGAKHKLVDRLLVTLVHLRHAATHDVLAAWFGVNRSTITRAIGEIRPLLAERGCRIDGGKRLSTVADVVNHLGASEHEAILDATEIRVRRPAAGQTGRGIFTSGKSKQNAVKALVLTDREGRMLFCGATRPGSCADITQARQAGLVDLVRRGHRTAILADAGYQGLGAQTGGRIITPPRRKFRTNPPPWYEQHYARQLKAHSSKRIRVEHGIAHLKNWKVLARHHGRREHLDDTVRAVAGLLSDHQRTR